MKTRIEYNGSTIAYTEGSVIKLHCKDEKMVDDLTISVSGEGGGGIEGGTQLSAPSISLDGDILTIHDESGLATSFDILVDGQTAGTIRAEQIAVYTLSGVWALNRQPSCTFDQRQNIKFTTYGGYYKAIIAPSSLGCVNFVSTTDNVVTAYNRDDRWYESRVIDFGNQPQRVSKAFYEWFTENAAKTRTLQGGWWVLKESPDLDSFPYGGRAEMDSIRVDFNARNERFCEIVVTPLEVMYSSSLDNTLSVYSSSSGWGQDSDRTIALVGHHEVPEDVYKWFTDNAYREIFGTWNLNGHLEMPEDEIIKTTNGFRFGDINVNSVNINSESLKVVSSDDTLTYILYVEGLWTHPDHHSVTIGAVRPVNGELYEWFIANATRDAYIEFTIDGKKYYAAEGMEWGEWCRSAYNTGEYTIEVSTAGKKVWHVQSGILVPKYVAYDEIGFGIGYVDDNDDIVNGRAYRLD